MAISTVSFTRNCMPTCARSHRARSDTNLFRNYPDDMGAQSTARACSPTAVCTISILLQSDSRGLNALCCACQDPGKATAEGAPLRGQVRAPARRTRR